MAYPTLKLKKNEDRRVLAGHLWIFSNEIDTQSTPLSGFQPGETVTVTSASGRPLANAYVNPHSLICARIFSHHARQALDSALFAARIKQALNLRQYCFQQPYYRLIYSEGDLLPGLVVDRFDNSLVMQISTLGMEVRQKEITEVLDELLQPPPVLVLCGAEKETAAWRAAVAKKYMPGLMTIVLPGDEPGLPPPLDKPRAAVTTAWLCRGTQCLPPITRLEELLAEL